MGISDGKVIRTEDMPGRVTPMLSEPVGPSSVERVIIKYVVFLRKLVKFVL